MDLTIVVATFGGHEWIDLARDRAIPSAAVQAPVIHEHGETLAAARNAGLAKVKTPWVAHLDADDELAPTFAGAMATGGADLRAPAVQYIRGGRPRAPYVPRVPGHDHDCVAGCLRDGNFLVCGAVARTEVLRQVGGWGEEAIYEDWALWLRCYFAGATVESIPAAVYRAHVRRDSRNRAPSRAVKEHWHKVIYDGCVAHRFAGEGCAA